MNKKDKVRYEQKLADYLEKNKVQETFHYLFRQLLLKKPDDPLAFLIKELQKKRKMRYIFMSGYAKQSLTDIAASVCAQMNFKHISYFNYIKSNSKVFRHNYLDNNILNKPILEQVCKDLEAVENEYVKGVLLEGFPNNLTQLLFLTKRGIIPSRFFYLNYDKEKELEESFKFLMDNASLYNFSDESSVREYLKSHRDVQQINVKQMKEGFPQMVTDLDGNKRSHSDIVTQIQQILLPKSREITPLRSPQILVLSLISNISNPIIAEVSKKFGLVKICAQELINKEIARKSILGHYCHIAREQGIFVPDDVYCTLTQNEIRKTHSQHLGWVMDGFPCTKKQLNKFISWRCPPQIIIVLNASVKYLNKKASLIKYDPSTKKVYNLSKEKPLPGHTPEKLKERLTVFQDMIEHMKVKFSQRMQMIDIEKTPIQQIHQKIKKMIEDPQFYS